VGLSRHNRLASDCHVEDRRAQDCRVTIVWKDRLAELIQMSWFGVTAYPSVLKARVSPAQGIALGPQLMERRGLKARVKAVARI
jgi:hypothetical protein